MTSPNKQSKQKKKSDKRPNYAFIDNQNVNVSIQRMGWKIDRGKMIRRLRRDFDVDVAYLFMWYIPEYQKMYDFFESLWYTLVFRQVVQWDHIPNKGNIDTELVLQAMIDIRKYEQAVIVSGDGDFTSLVEHLHSKKKLRCVIAPNKRRTSDFLQESADGRFLYLDGFKRKLGYVGEKKEKKEKKEKRKKKWVEKEKQETRSKKKEWAKTYKSEGKQAAYTKQDKQYKNDTESGDGDMPFWL